MTEVTTKVILEDEETIPVEGNKETEDRLEETKKYFLATMNLWMMVNQILWTVKMEDDTQVETIIEASQEDQSNKMKCVVLEVDLKLLPKTIDLELTIED